MSVNLSLINGMPLTNTSGKLDVNLKTSDITLTTQDSNLNNSIKIPQTDTYSMSSSANKAVIIGGVRNDNNATICTTTGNYSPFACDGTGSIYSILNSNSVQSLLFYNHILPRTGERTGLKNVSIIGTSDVVGTLEHTFAPTLHTLNRNLSFITVATTLFLSSTNVNDIAVTGTGAKIVQIFGLDASYNVISETVNMNGTSKSSSTINSFIAVNQLRVISVGSTGSNIGDIYCGASSDTVSGGIPSTNIYSIIQATYNLSSCAIYTIPAGFSLLPVLSSFSSDATSAECINAISFVRSNTAPVIGIIFRLSNTFLSTSTTQFSGDCSVALREKSTFFLTTKTKSGTAKAYANVQGVLLDNTKFTSINYS